MISAAGELAASAARDFILAAPSASCGSCCINDSPKYRSTAVGSFFRKMSIMAWRALAPKVSKVMTIHSDRDCSLGGRSGYDETRFDESDPRWRCVTEYMPVKGIGGAAQPP